MGAYFKKYFKDLNEKINDIERDKLVKFSLLIKSLIETNRKCIFVGNGGSASIASHVTVDLIKAANIKAINFNEANLLTCFSNDYGYSKVFSKSLDFYADKGDVVIIISSSGKSKNVLEAAKICKKKKILLYTLTGFSKTNPLKKMGDINLWVNSKAYNVIENVHQMWLLSIVDRIIGKTEYLA